MIPSATETLHVIGAGEQIVGRSDHCNWPKEVLALPSVGNLTTPNFETIVELKPDLVVAIESYGRKNIDRLRSLGLQVRTFYGDPSLEATYESIVAIGQWSGHEDAARAWIARMKTEIAAMTWPAERPRPRVLWMVWWDPLMAPGKRTFLHEIIEKAGGINIAGTEDLESYSISQEAVIASRPEVIVLPCMNAGDCASIGKRFHERHADKPGWSTLPAVQRQAYCPVDQDIAHRPGPRLPEAVRLVHDCFLKWTRPSAP